MPVLETLEAAVADLAQVEPSGLPPAALLETLQRLVRAADQLDAVVQQMVEAVEATGATWEAHRLGTVTWLRRVCHRSAGEAKMRVAVADRQAMAPAAVAAHATGDLSLAHVNVISRTLGRLPEDTHRDAEDILLRAARDMDPTDLTRVARHLEDTLAADEAEDAERRRYDSRWLTVSPTFGGMVHVEGMLDLETGEALLTALAPLAAPGGADDTRTAGQRRADALGCVARLALGSDQVPQTNGARPQVTVTIPLATLESRVGGAELAFTGPVTPETARRLACDAGLLPVVLGGAGEPLDIGQATNVWPVAIRRAAALRDHGCTFPGCHAPLALCQLHHIVWWSEGGATSLHNSAHLCTRHHTVVHQGDWEVRRHTDGRLVFTDPEGDEHEWRPPPTLRDYAVVA